MRQPPQLDSHINLLFPSFGLAEDRHLPRTLAEFGLHSVPVLQETFSLLRHFGGSLHCLAAECLREDYQAAEKAG